MTAQEVAGNGGEELLGIHLRIRRPQHTMSKVLPYRRFICNSVGYFVHQKKNVFRDGQGSYPTENPSRLETETNQREGHVMIDRELNTPSWEDATSKMGGLLRN